MTGSEETKKIINLIESKIEVITSLSIECMEQIYKAAYNEAIEVAAKLAESKNTNTASSDQIRKLKK